MSIIQIVSHGTSTDFGGGGTQIDRSVIESINGEAVLFRADGDAIESATVNGTPLEAEGPTYSFTPPITGLHRVDISFASGRKRALNVIRIGEDWLRRIMFPPGSCASKAHFIAKSRLALRSILRTRRADDGSFPEGTNLAAFGINHYVNPQPTRYTDLP